MSLRLMMSTMNKVIEHSMNGLRNNDNNKNNKNNYNNKMMLTASTACDGVGVPTVVLAVEVHCMGCARKIIRSVKCLEGVESVTVDVDRNKVTVVGEVDHLKIIDRVENRIHKKITSYTCTIEKKNEEEKPEKTVKMRVNGGECIHKIRRAVSNRIKGLKLINLNLLLDSCVHNAESNLDLQHVDKMSVEQEEMIMEKDDVDKDGDDDDDGKKKTSENDGDVTVGKESNIATTAENDGDCIQDELPNSNHHCAEIEIEIENDGDCTQEELPNSNHHCAEIEIEIEIENDGDCTQEDLTNSNYSWAELGNDGDYTTQQELPNSNYSCAEIENETYNVFSDENANACSIM